MTFSSKPNICVIGAGAIGGFFGARLANGAANVSVVARGRTLDALQNRGWTLESDGQSFTSKVRAVSDPAQLGVQDIVILSVKAHALGEIAAGISPLLGPSTLVIPAVNGVPWWFAQGMDKPGMSERLAAVDPDGTINAAIPASSIIGCVVYPSCSSPEPGVSRHNSGTRLVFGETGLPADAAVSERLATLVTFLKGAGFDAESTLDIRTEVWKKLLGNACFNPVSLLTGSATDLLIDDPHIYALFCTLMDELLGLGRVLGLNMSIKAQDRIATTRKLGNVKTSMLQDVEAGRPVEIEAILGAVIELAGQLGVAVPTASSVYALARMRAKTFNLLKS